MQRPALVTQTLVIRRSAVPDLRFPEDLRIGEDLYFQFDLASRRPGIAAIKHPHVIYWAHEENTTAAGGRELSPAERVRFFEDMEQFELRLLGAFPLTKAQRRGVLKRMATNRFWNIGFHGHLAAAKVSAAHRSFRQALYWDSANLSLWKSYLALLCRGVRNSIHDGPTSL